MEDKVYIGIDLGTTYCSIAYLDEDGTPIIEKNLEGETETPSVVFFSPTGGGFTIGSEAKGKSNIYPEYTRAGVKRDMGKDTRYSIGQETYTPVEISAMILRKMVSDFRKTRGLAVEDAVITVPAYFGDAQREATRTAAQLAGIRNVELINEPTAAAIAYGYGERDGGHKRILVYDFGGGTLDVTILDVDGSSFTAIATDGATGLGGRDFDDVLTRIILEKIASNSGTDYYVLDTDIYLLADLEVKSERMKIRLSSSETASDTVTLNNGLKVPFEVTRAEFEEATRGLLDESFEYVKKALKAARLTADDINAFVLVGGSSRMPMVAEEVRSRYPGVSIDLFDPLHAVANGAALYAGRDGSAEIDVKNVLSKTFGVKVCDGSGNPMVSNIIYRNRSLPMSAAGRFHPEADGQLVAKIEIYESAAMEGDKHTEMDDAAWAGTFELKLPESVTVNTPIMVHFTANAEGIIRAVAECGARKEEYTLKTAAFMTDEEFARSTGLMEQVDSGE